MKLLSYGNYFTLLVSMMMTSKVYGFGRSLLTIRRMNKAQFCSSSRVEARPSSSGLSLDTNLIASQLDLVLSHMKARRCDGKILDDITQIKSLREDRNALIVEGDNQKNIRNKLSKEIGMRMGQLKIAEDKTDLEKEIADIKAQVEDAAKISAECDDKLAVIDKNINEIFTIIPNLLDDSVPEGDSEADNPIISSWGDDMRKLGEAGDYLWHDEIARNLNGVDIDAAASISGARFSVVVGPVARLERALSQFFLDFHSSRGYTEVSVPYIVSRSTLEGTGQLPKFEDDLFKVSHSVAGEDAFLIPTAEVPVTNIFRGQLLNSTQLPIHLVCLTPSFRAEAGSYGRDTRGLLRQHQFHKVELVKICAPETSAAEHEALTADAEAILQALELPYRKVLLCSGDIGFSARKCYDLEVWLPGQQAYREVSSCSNCFDFQSRRMSLRYRPAPPTADPNADAKEKKSKKPKKVATAYPHTMNGSGVAVGRCLVAVLENYQQPDGSVIVPEKLRPYMGRLERIELGAGVMYSTGSTS